MVERYERLDQKFYESHYLLLDTIIEHPIEKVWPRALKISSWMTDHRLETIAGESGKVGHFEKVFEGGLGSDVPLPHYHLYGVSEIILHKYIALEVFWEKGGSYGNTREMINIDNLLFDDLGGKTKLTFLAIILNLGEAQKQSNGSQTSPEDEDAQMRKQIARYFETLKQLVKADS